MRRTLTSSLLALALLISLLSALATRHTASAATTCQFLSNPSAVPAFCDTFDAPAGIGNRSGQLDGTVWGVTRAGNTAPGQGEYDGWLPTAEDQCGTTVTVQPENDVNICDGLATEATSDGGTVTSLAMYPKQPFDFANRTGTVSFDVSNDSQGSHMAWPEFWMSDQPVPDPFSHGSLWEAMPRNGFGLRLDAVCNGSDAGSCAWSQHCLNLSGNRWTLGDGALVSNYADSEFYASSSILHRLDCVSVSSGPGDMNHVEIQVSQNAIDVYATDAGTTGPLYHIANLSPISLSFTRGFIWLEDVHYNANKTPGTQGVHTFTWDNVGFDGAVLPRDLAFDVPDSLTHDPANGGVNLGYGLPTDGAPLSLQTTSVYTNTDPVGGLLTFSVNTQASDEVLPEYSLNGSPYHTIAWPYPDGTQMEWRTIGVPIDLSEVVPGVNTIRFLQPNSDIVTVANVDIILQDAGGLPGSAPTATAAPPTNTPAPPTSTATPAPSPTPMPISGVPCTIQTASGQLAGTCSGTFQGS